jgi:hypothetical protein
MQHIRGPENCTGFRPALSMALLLVGAITCKLNSTNKYWALSTFRILQMYVKFSLVTLSPVKPQLKVLWLASHYDSEQELWQIILEHWRPTGNRDSSVGIATRYGLEGPGIESRWAEIFRTYPDRLRGPPSLLYNEYRVFPGGKDGRSVMLTTHPLLVLRLRKSWAITPLTRWVLLGLLRGSLYPFFFTED